MKDKDSANMDEKKTDGIAIMNRRKGVGEAGGPQPEKKASRIVVRPKDKAQRDIVAAVVKAREVGTISCELSNEDIAGIVMPVVDTLYDAYEEAGTIPTREAFAKRCTSEDVGGVVLGMSRDPFVKRRLGGKAIAAICIGCAVVAVLVGVGVWTAVGGQTQAAFDTGVSEPAGMYDESDEAQTEPDNDAADKSDAKTDEDVQDVTDKEAIANNPVTEEGFATGGGSVSSEQQSHTHNWVPVTMTVHHDAQYKTVHHDAVIEYRNICNGCGRDITGNEAAHAKEALLNGNTACGAWHTEPVTVQDAYDEQVLVQAAYDETVTTGYKCSICGATK